MQSALFPLTVVCGPERPMRRMKSTWYLMWILIGFVVLAAVDRVPDSPSSKLDSVKCSVSSPHELPVAFGTTSRFLIVALGNSEASAAFAPLASGLPVNGTERLERATDPSPPTLHSRS
jgi:hypothetical protein